MRHEKPKNLADLAPLVFPALMLLVFFVIPFGIMIAVSFFRRQQGGFYTTDFVLENYERFLSAFFGGVLGFSLLLAACVAVCCVLLAYPFTYFLTCRTRRVQIVWLVALLSVLSLSEVIIGFAWSTLFSRTAGIRLEPTLLEASRTLGASPLRGFFDVVIPASRNTIVATLIMVFVFALGSYLLPQILGRPQHWTLSVLITDQAIYQSNMPFAAAMAVFLVLISLALVGLTLLIGGRREAQA